MKLNILLRNTVLGVVLCLGSGVSFSATVYDPFNLFMNFLQEMQAAKANYELAQQTIVMRDQVKMMREQQKDSMATGKYGMYGMSSTDLDKLYTTPKSIDGNMHGDDGTATGEYKKYQQQYQQRYGYKNAKGATEDDFAVVGQRNTSHARALTDAANVNRDARSEIVLLRKTLEGHQKRLEDLAAQLKADKKQGEVEEINARIGIELGLIQITQAKIAQATARDINTLNAQFTTEAKDAIDANADFHRKRAQGKK